MCGMACNLLAGSRMCHSLLRCARSPRRKAFIRRDGSVMEMGEDMIKTRRMEDQRALRAAVRSPFWLAHC